MPYISQMLRDDLKGRSSANFPGELNYMLTLWVKDYWEKHPNYQGINDIIGALEGCKMEFYRRIAVPYEDEKIKTNGDVY